MCVFEQVNVIGLCVCNREFMKQARDREMDDGHIILLNRCGQHNTVGFRTLIFPFFQACRGIVWSTVVLLISTVPLSMQ